MSGRLFRLTGNPGVPRIPADWRLVRLKFVTSLAYGDSLPNDTRLDGEVPVFGSNGQVGTHVEANTKAPAIIVGRKGSFGKVTWSNSPGFCIDTTYFTDPRYAKADLRWLFYTLQTLGLDEISQDTGVPGLAREKAYNAWVALPELPEQRSIADFLDHKTKAIDDLIEKKERLIELL